MHTRSKTVYDSCKALPFLIALKRHNPDIAIRLLKFMNQLDMFVSPRIRFSRKLLFWVELYGHLNHSIIFFKKHEKPLRTHFLVNLLLTQA